MTSLRLRQTRLAKHLRCSVRVRDASTPLFIDLLFSTHAYTALVVVFGVGVALEVEGVH